MTTTIDRRELATRATGWSPIRARMCAVVAGVACAAAALLVGPPAAQAQGVRASARAGPGGMASSPITSRELDAWSTILSLTGEQKEAAKTLHQAYQDEYKQESKALQDLMKAAQQEFMETQDGSVFKDIGAKSKVHTEKMESLDKQFMDDVKALLEPRQVESFPRVERHHRRVKSLPGGLLAGETVNLVSIADDLKLDAPSPEFKDAMEQYEIDLDRALTDRDQQRKDIEKQGEDMMKDFDASKMDFTKIRQMMSDARKTGIKVRDVNERHARRIAGTLPADKKSDFEDRVKRATYPQVFREAYPVKAMDAALAMADITSEQKESINAIRDAYQRDAAGANDKWSAAISEEEKDGGGDPFMGFGKFVPGGGSDDKSPADEAKKARRDLDKATVEKLKAILTDAQKEKLPERESDFPWMGNFAGSGGDDADDKPAKPVKRK